MEFKIYCILNMYGKPLLFVFGVLIAIALLVKKPNIFYIDKLLSGSKHIKKLESAVYLLILFFSLIGIILSFPLFLDLPAVLTNDFQYDIGRVVSYEYSEESDKRNRTVTIENHLGNVQKYYIFRCPRLEEGNIVTIHYYKHSRNGFLK